MLPRRGQEQPSDFQRLQCPRCGEVHDLHTAEFTSNPIVVGGVVYRWFAICPTYVEPIIFTGDPSETKEEALARKARLEREGHVLTTSVKLSPKEACTADLLADLDLR